MKCPPNIVVQIIHIHGSMKGIIQEFTDDLMSIGRLPSYTIHFPPHEPGVSRDHARIERVGNQFKLTDVSKFGTSVNGRQVKEAFLKNGDVLEFGAGGPKASFHIEVREIVAESAAVPFNIIDAPPMQSGRAPIIDDSRLTTTQDVATREAAPIYKETVDRIIDLPPQRVKAPLIIQYGPTIRTYNELPVVIGKHASCDFAIQHVGITFEQHAQIFYSQNNYWIKDLTGQCMIRINNKQIDIKVQLNKFDEIGFSSRGPVFRYLGDGRLAEVETPHEEPHVNGEHELKAESRSESTGSSTSTSFMSKLIRGFK